MFKKVIFLVLSCLTSITLLAVQVGNRVAANAVRLHNDKIYATGFVNVSGTRNFILARYNLDGSLDTTFAAPNGYIIPPIAAEANEQIANALVIQPDGDIVIGGFTNINNKNHFALLRITSAGTVDPSFGINGYAITEIHDNASINAITLQIRNSSPYILATGTIIYQGTPVIAVARYTPNGDLDITFGGESIIRTSDTRQVPPPAPNPPPSKAGITITQIGNRATANDMIITQEDNILIAGMSAVNKEFITLVQYNQNGDLDSSFGNNGITITQTAQDTAAHGVAQQSDGKIVIAGNHASNFLLARYTASGILDSSFGDNGFVLPRIGRRGKFNDLAIFPTNHIIAVGTSAKTQAVFARFNVNGARNIPFGNNGFIIINNISKTAVNDVVIQPDNQIVGAGFICNDLALYRLSVTGALDPSFGETGIVRNPEGTSC